MPAHVPLPPLPPPPQKNPTTKKWQKPPPDTKGFSFLLLPLHLKKLSWPICAESLAWLNSDADSNKFRKMFVF